MLAAGCLFLMGSYFCYDNPTPLKVFLQDPPFDLSETQWSFLFSIYSFPNMVLPLFGGIFIDKVGIR
jgi:MFS family permease